jgi:hypothetical protein
MVAAEQTGASVAAFREFIVVGLLCVGIVFIVMLLGKWGWDYGRWKFSTYIEKEVAQASVRPASAMAGAGAGAGRK